VSVEAGLLRSRLKQTLLALLWPFALMALVGVLAFTLTPALIASLPLAVIGGIFLAIKRATVARPVVARGSVRLNDGVIELGARPLANRTEITSGVMVPGAAEGVVVRLERRRRVPIDLSVADVDRAREVLLGLQLDPARAVARFQLLASDPAAWKKRMQRLVPALVLFGATVAITARSGMLTLLPLHVFLMVALALSMIIPSRVTVGSDGISIRRFGREEFIALDGIADAVAGDTEPVFGSPLSVVRLLDGEGRVVRELVVDQKKYGPFTEGIHLAIDARARSLADRIRETIRLRNARKEPFDPRTLARGDRDMHVWLSDLRALLSQATGFRDVDPPTTEALLSLVEDASARPMDRAAAAIALSRSDESIKHRVRVVAEATAAPQLRIALEAAAIDDEQKLTSALDEIERARNR
jgi:hypothetical protein